MTTTEPLRRSTTPARVVTVRGSHRGERTDVLATEEPLEIRAQGPDGVTHQVGVTMRTPGLDFELAAGSLFTEGLIGARDVRRIAYCDDLPDDEQRFNVVTVWLERPFDPELLRRNFTTNSSCGVCGKAALDDIHVRCVPVPEGFVVDQGVIGGLPDSLRSAQSVFDRTGGLHAAGFFSAAGDTVSVTEDVGRHNAVDKLIGERVLHGAVPVSDLVMQVSGRLGFEIVQKAAAAQVPVVSAVGAPSSLAVEAARRFEVTLIGFVREGRFNIYSRPDRVV